MLSSQQLTSRRYGLIRVADGAADAVTTLQMAGVINGTSDTTFEAEAGATRAQAAQMIYNLYQVIK